MYLKMHCLLLAILHPVLLLKCTDTSRDAGSLIFLILLFYTENHCPCHVQSSEHALGVICSSILHQHNLRSPKSWYGDLYLQFFQSTGWHFLGICNFLASGHIIQEQILSLFTSEVFWSHDSTQMR